MSNPLIPSCMLIIPVTSVYYPVTNSSTVCVTGNIDGVFHCWILLPWYFNSFLTFLENNPVDCFWKRCLGVFLLQTVSVNCNCVKTDGKKSKFLNGKQIEPFQ